MLGPHSFILRQQPHTTLCAYLPFILYGPKLDEGINSELFRDADSVRVFLQSYFQVDSSSLRELYEHWGGCCERMRMVCEHVPGLRVVRQDPFDCLVAFVCSSNNNIPRISLMLQRLRGELGRFSLSLELGFEACLGDGSLPAAPPRSLRVTEAPPPSPITPPTPPRKRSPSPDPEVLQWQPHPLFQLPSAQALAGSSEPFLRGLGLGYRAGYLLGTARMVADRDAQAPSGDWLAQLRAEAASGPCSRLRVQRALLALPGVGPKVADCVALFSLDQAGAVPVDTHVWAIARRDYLLSAPGPQKSLTPSLYEAVGDELRRVFGPRAGWAHSVLFAAELPHFRRLLPEGLQSQMRGFDEQERADKRAAKERKKLKAALKAEGDS